MVFYAHLLQEALDSPTIVVMTDRIDLDDQLYTQFAKCAPFLRQTPVQATSKENLRELLDGRQANGIIFTTMFKFERRPFWWQFWLFRLLFALRNTDDIPPES